MGALLVRIHDCGGCGCANWTSHVHHPRALVHLFFHTDQVTLGPGPFRIGLGHFARAIRAGSQHRRGSDHFCRLSWNISGRRSSDSAGESASGEFEDTAGIPDLNWSGTHFFGSGFMRSGWLVARSGL